MPSVQDGIGQCVHSTVSSNKKRKMLGKKEPLLTVHVHYYLMEEGKERRRIRSRFPSAGATHLMK